MLFSRGRFFRPPRYYSDWVVDAVSVHEEIGSFATNWTVPKAQYLLRVFYEHVI